MIISHPFLFNTIVVCFIAFTSGWLVYAFNSRKTIWLKKQVKKLRDEKDQADKKIITLEQQLENHLIYPLNSTPVIALSSVKVNQSK